MSNQQTLPKWTRDYPLVVRLCNADASARAIAGFTENAENPMAQFLIRLAVTTYGEQGVTANT